MTVGAGCLVCDREHFQEEKYLKSIGKLEWFNENMALNFGGVEFKGFADFASK